MANTEDRSGRFADEARSIRVQASPREAVELLEEDIDVMPLPMPAALKETLQ